MLQGTCLHSGYIFTLYLVQLDHLHPFCKVSCSFWSFVAFQHIEPAICAYSRPKILITEIQLGELQLGSFLTEVHDMQFSEWLTVRAVRKRFLELQYLTCSIQDSVFPFQIVLQKEKLFPVDYNTDTFHNYRAGWGYRAIWERCTQIIQCDHDQNIGIVISNFNNDLK